MSCLLTSGATRQCAHEFGGLKELYLGNFSEVTAVTTNPSTGEITGFTMTSGATFYTFEFVKDTAQALEELQDGPSSFIQQTINFQLNGITLQKRDVLNEISLGTFVVIAKKPDDNYWVFGLPATSIGLDATTDNIDSGTAFADPSSAIISLVGPSTAYALTATDAAVAAVI
jgi:hypothetical protein